MASRPKSRPTAPPPQPPKSGSRTPYIIGGLTVVALAVGVFGYLRSGADAPAQNAQDNQSPKPAPLAPLPGPPPYAKFGPHTQAELPPLPFNGFPPARPVEVVGEVYKFAAEHPEVLGYVPCYCGCERSGHRGNDDCFVSERAKNGDVTGWEPHGMT